MDSEPIARLPRLVAILTILQSQSLVTAAQIADRFQISKRTVYRDIRSLEEAGVPIYSEEGKGYSLVQGFALPPVMFTEEEAYALITAEKLVARNKDQSLVTNHGKAITKIRAVLKAANKNHAALLSGRIANLSNLACEITSSNLSTLQWAITHYRVLHFRYFSLGKQEHTQRKVEPMALYQARDNWILIAWCHLRSDYREFRLDHIEELQLLNEQYPARQFNLIHYFHGVAEKSRNP